MLHNCRQCVYLRKTSASQMFWLCELWSSKPCPARNQRWVEAHCHMQPSAPACDHFTERSEQCDAR